MRTVAILNSYNEKRFIGACLENLISQGVEAYLVDNGSTDETLDIAERFLGRGLIGIEQVPRDGIFSLKPLLQQKEELAQKLDADWFMHADCDEIRRSPKLGQTLGQALAEVDQLGYNAVNFTEFIFVPTQEEPNHDHPRFSETMRWYFPHIPCFPHRVNAWKRQEARVNLADSGGHRVKFEGLRMFPHAFVLRHYIYLSIAHAEEKYAQKIFDSKELDIGWHGSRAKSTPRKIVLPSASELRTFTSDAELDHSPPPTNRLPELLGVQPTPATKPSGKPKNWWTRWGLPRIGKPKR